MLTRLSSPFLRLVETRLNRRLAAGDMAPIQSALPVQRAIFGSERPQIALP